jgi:hypothetical protein
MMTDPIHGIATASFEFRMAPTPPSGFSFFGSNDLFCNSELNGLFYERELKGCWE